MSTNLNELAFFVDVKSKGYPCFMICGGEEYVERTKCRLRENDGLDILLYEENGLFSIVGWAPTEEQLISFLENHGMSFYGYINDDWVQ